jgi:hypothetical protein
MALDGSAVPNAPERERPLHAVLSSAITSVADAWERLRLTDASAQWRIDDNAPADDPHGEAWASIHGAVAAGVENAAFAAGLHHRAAADLDEVTRELSAIAALVRHRSDAA